MWSALGGSGDIVERLCEDLYGFQKRAFNGNYMGSTRGLGGSGDLVSRQ